MRPLPITVTAKFFFLFFSAALLPMPALVQWKVGASAEVAPPLTSYCAIIKTGWLLSGEGRCRLGNGNFTIGMENKMVRFLRDKSKRQDFTDTKLMIAPILLLAEYEANQGKKLRRYVAAGLG